jgi:hypothetical protein
VNLTTARTELLARGFNYLDASGTTRQDGYLNRALHLINESGPWEYLVTSSSGAAPLTVSDLRSVLSVVHTSGKRYLKALDRRVILEQDPDQSRTGSPEFYWIDGLTTVRVWPISTDSISVRYLKNETDLTTGETPLLPARYHHVWIDQAAVLAYRDDDNFEAARELQASVDREIAGMLKTLTFRTFSNPDYIVMTGSSTDG